MDIEQFDHRSTVRPFSIMLVKLAFYAPSNTRFMPKNAKIMLDSQNNATLITENALSVYSKQNVRTHYVADIKTYGNCKVCFVLQETGKQRSLLSATFKLCHVTNQKNKK